MWKREKNQWLPFLTSGMSMMIVSNISEIRWIKYMLLAIAIILLTISLIITIKNGIKQ